jgi:hypothetical protein
VTFAVTTDAKRNQVVRDIVTELAPGVHVMDLQHPSMYDEALKIAANPRLSESYPR